MAEESLNHTNNLRPTIKFTTASEIEGCFSKKERQDVGKFVYCKTTVTRHCPNYNYKPLQVLS